MVAGYGVSWASNRLSTPVRKKCIFYGRSSYNLYGLFEVRTQFFQMRTEQSSSHCANLIVALPQETFPLGESSKSPLHFAAHRDESVIVGYYTSEEVHLRSPSPLDEPRKGGCPWQEMMVLTAPVSGCVGGMPCMVRPSIWHGLHYCLRCAGVPGALEWTTAHRQGIQPPVCPARSFPQPPKK